MNERVVDERDGDEGWVMHFDVSHTNRRAVESMTVLSDGDFATRCLTPRAEPTEPTTLAAGLYDGVDVPSLRSGPLWTAMSVRTSDGATERADLDLFRGVLTTAVDDVGATVRSTRFASIARPGIHVLKVVGPNDVIDVASTPVAAVDGFVIDTHDLVTDDGHDRQIVRFAALAASDEHGAPDIDDVRRLLTDAVGAGYDQLLDEHETAWRERWRQAAVDLPANTSLERAVRFAQFHLLAAAPQARDAGIGARGLTGAAYRGHIFWDTDVYVVPALAAMAPGGALTALRYRWNRLEPAQRRAIAEGRAGARFPWESAASGEEVAPTVGRDLHGGPVPILTGQLEEHIVADIAWTALTYVAWTGDHDSEQGPVADLLVETARYWQSRVEVDSDGSRHIRGVIGPDEYHERIDDNAYTNVLARWNLTAAADIVERLGMSLDDEAALWRTTSRHIADGYDTTRGIYEQFDGFFDLDEVMAASLGEPPLAADALLGRERIRRTQIIKQPDVVMLHHVVPDSMRPGTLERDLDFYLPRTSHGSSLSPAITASVLARAGRLEEACHWFGFAASFDFDDVSNTTAGGVHLATLGGLWQALAVGFFGLRPSATGLYVDPHVPDEWGTVTIRIHVRGVPVEVEASGQRFAATAPVPITVLNRHGASATGCRVRAASDGNDWRFT